jgi:predicted ATPase/DNA-binding SARP family transcriptional activator
MARLTISLLGTFQVLIHGTEITGFDSDKVRALLAYLAVESNRPHRRAVLANLLWPDRPEHTARHNLSQALYNLRTLLGDAAAVDDRLSVLAVDRQAIQFEAASDCRLDVAAFTAAMDACAGHPHRRLDLCESCIERLHQALDLYRGSFLEGLSVDDSAPFEEWMRLQQERFHRLAVDALCRLARCHELRGDNERALRCLRRCVQLEPWSEDAHWQAMRLLAATGRRDAALAQYEACRQALAAELGIEPGAGTAALCRTIRDGGELPADRSLPPHNLPAPATSFVGRETKLAQIDARLRERDCRLVTLVGPGGSGKTRLALEAARDVLYAGDGDRFMHGIYFVSLAPLQSAEAIVPAVAQAIGFSFRAGSEPRQQLLDYLQNKRMLLVLDNAEHLLEGRTHGDSAVDSTPTGQRDCAGVVANVLQAAANVKLLVTSRTSLNLHGEHLVPVPGMEAPPPTPSSDMEDVGRYSAVRLFLEAAGRVRPSYEPAHGDLAQVGRICRLVAGMPLGILLAAGWMRTLPPADIAAQIGQSLDFLQDAASDVPFRQRSMRATFDHSWRLLAERERELFPGVSVFAGGFTHAAAQQVVGATLAELRGLVVKSMLACGPTGRYEVHELLRQYGRERLAQIPAEEEAVRSRHCATYATYLRSREAALIGREQKKALAAIEAEIDNVRAAWDWAVSQIKIEEIENSLGSLAEFYYLRAWYQEGEAVFAHAAQRLTEGPTGAGRSQETWRRSALVLARILAQQGRFCNRLGLPGKAGDLLRASLSTLRELGARRETAYALSYLGDVLVERGIPPYREALGIFREIGDQRGVAIALHALGSKLVPQGEYSEARRLTQESLTRFRALGDAKGIRDCLASLGYIAWILGEYKVAQGLHQEAYALSTGVADRYGMAHALMALGRDAAGLGDYERCKQLYHEGVAILQDIGNLQGVAGGLGDLSELATVLGEYAEAAQLAQESLTMDQRLSYPIEIAWASRVLGNVAREQNDLQGARRYLRRALEMGVSARATAPALLTVTGIAALLIREGELERPAELLALVLHHPWTWQWTKERAAPLVARLEAALSPERFAAAQERGRARDLETTVQELLAELEG